MDFLWTSPYPFYHNQHSQISRSLSFVLCSLFLILYSFGPVARSSTIAAPLVVSAVVVCAMAATVAYLMTRPAGAGRAEAGPAALDLADVSGQKATEAGLKLPPGADRVYYRGRKIPGTSTTYARYDMPPRGFVQLQRRLAGIPGARLDENLPVPGTWPTLTGQMAAPPWFLEQGKLASKIVVIVDHAGSAARPSGKYWVLDGARRRVYIWSWSVNIGKK